MSEQTELSPVGQLLLARLLVAGDKGATGSEIKKALEPLLAQRWAGAALTERLREALAELEGAGLAILVRKGKTEREALSAEGRRRALAVLGPDQLPPKTTWDKVKKIYLAARALGLPTPSGKLATQFGGDPGFKAALLKTRFGLPLADFPALQDALDALTWTLLGLEPGPKFTAKAVQTALIARELGQHVERGPKADPKKEVAKLLAREVGARQAGKDELRLAALRRWVDEAPVESGSPGPVSVPQPEPVPVPLEPLDLPAFAQRVVEAARASRTGRFGDDKVFVAHVWRSLQDDAVIGPLGLDAFKRRLAEANNARLLDLSRADMVEAMDSDDVRLSEIPYLGATFHFVRI